MKKTNDISNNADDQWHIENYFGYFPLSFSVMPKQYFMIVRIGLIYGCK